MLRRLVPLPFVVVACFAALTSPAAAKLPPFTVTATPRQAVVGELVTVEIRLRDAASSEKFGTFPAELEHVLSVRALLPSGTPDATHAGLALVPQRASAGVWRATFVPEHVGRYAVVSFDNVVASTVDDYVPGPVRVSVREVQPVAATRAAPPLAPPARDEHGTTSWFIAAGALAALALTGAAALAWRHHARTRVA
jgi:hypothetical protein